MGYRAVAITESIPIPLPQWFIDKWHEEVHIGEIRGNGNSEKEGQASFPISYKYERKYHNEIIDDLQKVMIEQNSRPNIALQVIMMHEDGKVNRINIYIDRIIIESPTGWQKEDELWQY